MEQDIVVIECKGRKYFFSKKEYDTIHKWKNKQEIYWWKYYRFEHDTIRAIRAANRVELKWCEVRVAQTLKRGMIDINTGIIYKVDKYKPTNMIQKYGIVIRYLNINDI